MMNEYRHFYLYAKGHYKRTDTFEDLKKIAFDLYGFEVRHHLDILLILTNLIKEHTTFDRFINVLTDHIRWDIFFTNPIYHDLYNGKPCTNNRNSLKLIVDVFLSILRYIDVSDIDGELGSPDKNILPLSKEYIKKILDKA